MAPRNKCRTCHEKYDSREDNIGLNKGNCKQCNIKGMYNAKIIFENKCIKCKQDYDSREDNIGPGLTCLKCSLDGLKDTQCETKPHARCENCQCEKCFNKSFAKHEKAIFWHPTKNGHIRPRDISLKNNKKCWFKCGECNHSFDIRLGDCVRKNTWCKFCANLSQCDDKNCAFCFNNSFARYEKSKYWHSTKNSQITPRNIALTSGTKYWFKCGKCKHDFDASPSNVSHGYWCRFCANLSRCDNEKCVPCFRKSFASNERAIFWHPTKNGTIRPRDVALNGRGRYWFKCGECKHDINKSLSYTSENKWCKFCTNQSRCDSTDCKFCFGHSFASHEKEKFWHPTKNGNIKPRDVALNSHKKYWFKCGECDSDFDSGLNSVCRGTWCKFCKNKTEKKLLDFLMGQFNHVIYQFKTEWCKNVETNKSFPFDFCIPSHKVIIELDGAHHFKNIDHWRSSADERQDRDKYKMEVAGKHNYSVIRIFQVDVWKDTYNWQEDLVQAVNLCKNSSKIMFCSKNKELYVSYK